MATPASTKKSPSKSPVKAPAKKPAAQKPSVDLSETDLSVDDVDDSAEMSLPVEDVLPTNTADSSESTAPASESPPPALVERLTSPSVSAKIEEASPKKSESASATQFDLPPCLDTEETTDNPASVKIIVEAHATGCLKCSHMVSGASVEYTDCHFSAGNKSCPAQSVKIVFVGRRNHFATGLLNAREAGDSNKVLRILAKLEAEPLELKDFVLRQAGLIV